jgi:RNA ligase
MSQKYPRTLHLPWSPGATKDDRIADDVSHLIGKNIVLLEKIDGSNTSLEKDGCFARSHNGPLTHSSFDLLKSLHASIKYKLPEDTQLFGEYVFARHSIEYKELPGYFLLFGVRYKHSADKFLCWESWMFVEEWAKEIGVPTVPILFNGIISSVKELEKLTNNLSAEKSACSGEREGVVVRIAGRFLDEDFSKSVFKFVRNGHVQTEEHWKFQEIIKNVLKENK